jgi:2-haloacid dehalogenase
MSSVLAGLAAEQEHGLPARERDALARSLPGWPVFPEVPGALAEGRRRGWRLVILSNTDRDLIEASMKAIGAPFEFAVVASEIDSYKPAHRHWEAFYARSGAERERHVHVGASIYHDISPAHELGISSIWINRLGERVDARSSRELPDLARLSDALDELVPPHGPAAPADRAPEDAGR